MAGERVPLVLLPRFSSFVGATTFSTHVLDVTAYSSLELAVWRAPMIGGGIFGFSTQQSSDRSVWTPCSGSQDVDPGDGIETLYTWGFDRQWFRARLLLQGANPGVTCWGQGYLIKRERGPGL